LLSKHCYQNKFTDLFNRLCYRNTVIKTNSQTTLTKQNTAKQQSNVLNSSIHKHLANTVIKKFTDLFSKPNPSNSQTCFLLSKPSPSKNKNSNSCVNCKIHSSLQIHRDWDSVRDPWHRGHGHVCNFTNKLLYTLNHDAICRRWKKRNRITYDGWWRLESRRCCCLKFGSHGGWWKRGCWWWTGGWLLELGRLREGE